MRRLTPLRRGRATARRADRFSRPGRVIAGAFASAVALGTTLLSLPVATAGDGSAPLLAALFTATSAVCVTGLVVVDTGTYWSGFGQAVVLGLIQAGGLGIMTLATLVAVLLSRRIGLRARLVAQAETRSLQARDVRRVVRNVVVFSLGCEAVVAVLLTARFAGRYGEPPLTAAYSGLFHAVSAFNNAGFSLHADSLVRYVTDPWVTLVVAAAVVVGGVGFPVVFELVRTWRHPRRWSVLTRLTVWTTLALLAAGTVVLTAAEATNPGTLGPMRTGEKLLAGFFASVMPRTAGFNTIDVAAMRPEGLLITDVLMFIGGGSAGTAGGIKVTTFALLAFVLWAEMRGEPDVRTGPRRVPTSTQRQALAVALLGVATVVVATLVLLSISGFGLERVLFEVVSAFSTVGLSTGITADLAPAGQVLLVVLMFVGRVGPLTVASALALRERTRRHQLPEERMIVG